MIEWIDVKKKLPERDVYVLVRIGEPECNVCYDIAAFCNEDDGDLPWWFGGRGSVRIFDEITHWAYINAPAGL